MALPLRRNTGHCKSIRRPQDPALLRLRRVPNPHLHRQSRRHTQRHLNDDSKQSRKRTRPTPRRKKNHKPSNKPNRMQRKMGRKRRTLDAPRRLRPNLKTNHLPKKSGPGTLISRIFSSSFFSHFTPAASHQIHNIALTPARDLNADCKLNIKDNAIFAQKKWTWYTFK